MNIHAGFDQAYGRGVYNAADALRLVNFHRGAPDRAAALSRQTLTRWLRSYEYKTETSGISYAAPLWTPDYANDDHAHFEISFRDLIELRFVKSFRALGMSLPTIRACIATATEILGTPVFDQAVQDGRTLDLSRHHRAGRGRRVDRSEAAPDHVSRDRRTEFAGPGFRG